MSKKIADKKISRKYKPSRPALASFLPSSFLHIATLISDLTALCEPSVSCYFSPAHPIYSALLYFSLTDRPSTIPDNWLVDVKVYRKERVSHDIVYNVASLVIVKNRDLNLSYNCVSTLF